ncbi:MAG: phospholipase, partial [Gammaproteobacteria bacterium]|nr:phospholipase [Gammaproteobacteria bacterium]
AIVAHVKSQWPIDDGRVLLTGMSDGGTFTYLAGLRDDTPFSHLAPCSASFHPLLLEAVSGERLKGLPIYLIHGALDWMFPVEVAQAAHDALVAGGAQVEYREIADLSHTYPNDENDRIIDWLMG